MIVNHHHRFIYLANRKTASTSIAICLSKHCGKRDIITPLGKDEAIRRELGTPGPRNFIPAERLPQYFALRANRKLTGRKINSDLKRIGFHTHMNAADALRLIPRSTWDSYLKFCFVRNPWDRAISQYYWATRGEANPISLDNFIAGTALEKSAQKSREMYSIQGRLAIDRICKYEDLEGELRQIFNLVNINAKPLLPRAKTEFRKQKQHYSKILSREQADRIARIFAEEIELAGYNY